MLCHYFDEYLTKCPACKGARTMAPSETSSSEHRGRHPRVPEGPSGGTSHHVQHTLQSRTTVSNQPHNVQRKASTSSAQVKNKSKSRGLWKRQFGRGTYLAFRQPWAQALKQSNKAACIVDTQKERRGVRSSTPSSSMCRVSKASLG